MSSGSVATEEGTGDHTQSALVSCRVTVSSGSQMIGVHCNAHRLTKENCGHAAVALVWCSSGSRVPSWAGSLY